MKKYILLLTFSIIQCISYVGAIDDLTVTTKEAYRSPFSCVFSGATDQDSCFSQTDTDTNEECVWCPLGADNPLGVCVSEKQAEMIEQKIPNLTCSRDKPSPPTPPSPPSPPSPSPPKTLAPTKTDNDPNHLLFKCLNTKSKGECISSKNHCTWCDTKAGYGVCLAGSAAESAKHSDWYMKCTNHTSIEDQESSLSSFTIVMEDYLMSLFENVDKTVDDLNYLRKQQTKSAANTDDEKKSSIAIAQKLITIDNSCMISYVNDQTEVGCTSSLDGTGHTCQWCSIAGMINICLTMEQATSNASNSLGIVCDTATTANDIITTN